MSGERNIPSPNFDNAEASSGFLPFSSTPLHANNFTPKGKQKDWFIELGCYTTLNNVCFHQKYY